MQNFNLPVVSVAEQTGLSLTQSETRNTGFSGAMALLYLITYLNQKDPV